MFACLEMDYEEADGDSTGEAAQKTQQTLTFYELDLGLNHVVRKYRCVTCFPFCQTPLLYRFLSQKFAAIQKGDIIYHCV